MELTKVELRQNATVNTLTVTLVDMTTDMPSTDTIQILVIVSLMTAKTHFLNKSTVMTKCYC